MNQDESLLLDNQLCFAFYACSKEIIRLYKPYLEELGLTYTQYITMMVLWQTPEITVKNLGKRLYLDSGTITPLLKKLEALDFVKKERNPDDERSVIVKLTKSGLELKDRSKKIPKEMLCCLNMSIEEAMQLKTNIRQVVDNLSKKE